MTNPIERLKTAGAALMPPAAAARVDVASEELVGRGFPAIPADYRTFLEHANGAQCAAFILLGTEPQPMAGGHQTEDIYEATSRHCELRDEMDVLALGRASGGVTLVYRSAEDRYALIDESSDDMLRSWGTIEEFMADRLNQIRR